jgi:spermidine synthase
VDSDSLVVRLAVAAVVGLGGVAALAWETLWQIQASLAFGASAPGAALTLAATMGGMAIGALLAGAVLRGARGARVSRPLVLLGVLELGIGCAGLVMLPGFHALEALDTGVWSVAPSGAGLVHGLGMALLVAPATLAMGATVPVFQLVARRHGVSISVLYGVNTAGAATGVLLLAFAVLPRLGVAHTVFAAAGVNATAFVAALLLGHALGRGRAPEPAPAPARLAAGPLPVAFGLALPAVVVTGLVTFGLEVAWFRAMRAAFWSTSATFAILLAAVLVPLAGGARLVPWLRRRLDGPGPLLAAAGVAILAATPVIERFDRLALATAGPHAVLEWFALSLASVGPAILLLSTALPWFLEDHPAPERSGWLYAANAAGSVAGALVAAFVLLPALGFARSSLCLGVLVLAVAVVLSRPRARVVTAAAGGLALALALAAASSPGRDRMYGKPDLRNVRIVAFDEGPDFTTTVVDHANLRALLIDGFLATAEGHAASHYMRAMGVLPAALHDRPESGLVICFGTGQTANGLRRASVGRVDVVDISGSVLRLAPLFRANEGVLEDPRVHAHQMDGRAWLRRNERRYDVITLEPMPPNFSGVNSLYSLEFYEIAASRLDEGGIVAQWLPIHLVSPEHAAAIVATFHAAFPDSLLWMDPLSGTGILLGRRRPLGDALGTRWPGLERATGALAITDQQIRAAVVLDAAGMAAYAATGRVITDDNRLLEYSDARAGAPGRLTRNREANRRILQRLAGRPLPRPAWWGDAASWVRQLGPGARPEPADDPRP